MSNSIDQLAALIASIAAVILSAICALWVWRQQRRLAAIQTELNSLSGEIGRLEAVSQDLLVRFWPRKRRKSSNPSSDTSQETSLLAPERPDEKNSNGSALVAPKTAPE